MIHVSSMSTFLLACWNLSLPAFPHDHSCSFQAAEIQKVIEMKQVVQKYA